MRPIPPRAGRHRPGGTQPPGGPDAPAPGARERRRLSVLIRLLVAALAGLAARIVESGADPADGVIGGVIVTLLVTAIMLARSAGGRRSGGA